MVQTYSDILQTRAGATPHTFDASTSGGEVLRLNEKAKKLIAMKVSHSLSAMTTDEGFVMAIKLTSSNWNGDRYFIAGGMSNSPPSTNESTCTAQLDIVPLDIDVEPNTTINMNVSTVAGAVQTGTHDITVEFLYADGAPPAELKASLEGLGGCPSAKGGTYAYNTALTTTAETAATGNATTLNIPAEATRIVGIASLGVLDTAVTASQELTGYYRVDYGLTDQGDQKYAWNGLSPGLGTEVDGGIMMKVVRSGVWIPNLPGRELQVRAYANPYGAITGGADYVINILWA